jgi:hypothetical protein
MGRLEHAFMSERTLPLNTTTALTKLEARFVVGAVALLSGLALADRVVAWMIGEFPTSAALWELRFEYLRPIAVFYDMASVSLGAISGTEFSVLLLAAAVALVAGTLSSVRLLRATCLHALLASCLVVCTYSLDPVKLSVAVGSPSPTYALLGALMAIPFLGLCLRIHAQYTGWSLDSLRFVRRLKLSATGIRSMIEAAAVEILEQLSPEPDRSRAVLAFIRAERRGNHSSQ